MQEYMDIGSYVSSYERSFYISIYINTLHYITLNKVHVHLLNYPISYINYNLHLILVHGLNMYNVFSLY